MMVSREPLDIRDFDGTYGILTESGENGLFYLMPRPWGSASLPQLFLRRSSIPPSQ